MLLTTQKSMVTMSVDPRLGVVNIKTPQEDARLATVASISVIHPDFVVGPLDKQKYPPAATKESKSARLEKNRMSARRSRKRKKIIVQELQNTLDALNDEFQKLTRENASLEEELQIRRRNASAVKAGQHRNGLVIADGLGSTVDLTQAPVRAAKIQKSLQDVHWQHEVQRPQMFKAGANSNLIRSILPQTKHQQQ